MSCLNLKLWEYCILQTLSLIKMILILDLTFVIHVKFATSGLSYISLLEKKTRTLLR